MSVKQLNDLQCLEQDLAAREQAMAKAQAAIGESRELKQARDNLVQAYSELNALNAEQKLTEYSINDISAKMAVANESLYSGRVKNPKELQNLQHELDLLLAQRNPLEEKDITLMEQVEAAEIKVKQRKEELTLAENIWLADQQSLKCQIEANRQAIEALRTKRQNTVMAIPAEDLALYNQLKKIRGWGIAKVVQGTCGSCRLNLSSAEIQRAHAGQSVTCSSCGRILFFE